MTVFHGGTGMSFTGDDVVHALECVGIDDALNERVQCRYICDLGREHGPTALHLPSGQNLPFFSFSYPEWDRLRG